MIANQDKRHFDLTFASDHTGRTFLHRQFVRYPFHVCRGLYLNAHDGGACSVALQSTSGGLFEADATVGRIAAGLGARAQVNTSAATIAHAMHAADASQRVDVEADAGSVVVYAPQPLILFPHSAVRSSIDIQAHADASVIVSESFLTHDPNAGEDCFRMWDSRLTLRSNKGELLAQDRQLLTGKEWLASSLGVSNALHAYANVWIIQRTGLRELLAAARSLLDAAQVYGGASLLPHATGIHVRMLCRDGVELKKCMTTLLDLAQCGTRRAQHESMASA